MSATVNAKDLHYSSYMPALLRALAVTTGAVLELGMGRFSTPLLHWACVPHRRWLASYDYDPKWVAWARQFHDPAWHGIYEAPAWEVMPIEQPWDVVLVDHSPAARRKCEIARLAPWAKFLIVHDTDRRNEKHYDFASVWPLFRARYDVPGIRPRTTVVSNLVDLREVFPW